MNKTLKLLFLALAALALILCAGSAALAEGAGYTVEFTFGGQEYVLPGGGQAPLAEILKALGLEGEAASAAVSDEALFSASNETGEWVISSHRPFATREWMTVTLDGETWEITVTDDASLSLGDNQVTLGSSYSFTPTESGKYFIYSVGDRDTKGDLFDGSGNAVASNDDYGDDSNFRLFVDLTASQTYRLAVNPYDSQNNGIPYTVRVEKYAAPPLGLGDNAVYLGASYPFTPSESGKYLFYSVGSEDPSGELFDGSGNAVASNDDYGDDSNFRFFADLTASQTYRLAVTASSSYNDGTPYTVHVQKYVAPPLGLGDNAVYLGVTYPFTPTESGKYVFYSVGDEDTKGELFDGNGRSIASDDDSGQDSNFRFFVDLTAGNTYRLAVTSYSSYNNGMDYTVCVEQLVASPLATGNNTVYLGVTYPFTPSESGKYLIYSVGSEDTTGELFNEYNTLIASDDGSGQGSNFRLFVDLAASQTYRLVVTPEDSDYIGTEYTVHVEKYVAPPLVTGDNAVYLGATYPFIPSESGYYFFSSTGYEDTVGELFDGNGHAIVSDDDSGTGSNFRLFAELTASQTYRLAVTPCYSDDQGTACTVRVEKYVPSALAPGDNAVYLGAAYSFTPSESGTYLFYSVGDEDTKGDLFDGNGNFIIRDEDSGEESNFRLFAELTASQTYRLAVTPCYSDDQGTACTVHIEKYVPSPLSIGENAVVLGESYTFTPEEFGVYTFYSVGSKDTIAELFEGNSSIDYDDNSGEGNNFRFSTYLSGSQTYRLAIETGSSSQTGTVQVVVLREYDITVSRTQNGRVNANCETAPEGGTVTLTVAPNQGFVLAENSLTVTWMNGDQQTPVTVTAGTGGNAGQWTFTMPAGSVTVSASFIPLCTVTYASYDGTQLETYTVAQGQPTPAFTGSTPTRPMNAQYTYNFSGWDPALADTVTGNITYTAQFTETLNKWPIIFMDEFRNGQWPELTRVSVTYGDMPVYPYDPPTKPEDENYHYDFAGWDPVLQPVTGTATYTAVYSKTRRLIIGKNTLTLENQEPCFGTFTPGTDGEFFFHTLRCPAGCVIDLYDGETRVGGGTSSSDGSIAFTVQLTGGRTYRLSAVCQSGDGEMDLCLHTTNVHHFYFNSGEHGEAEVYGVWAIAEAGQVLDVVGNPEEGYILMGITVTGENGETVEVMDSFSFEMPNFNVYITPSFRQLMHIDVQLDEEKCGCMMIVEGRFQNWEDGLAGGLPDQTVEMWPYCWDGEFEIAAVTVTAENGTEIVCSIRWDEDSDVPTYWFVIPDSPVTVDFILRQEGCSIVSFAPAGGAGRMEAVNVLSGGVYALPDCGFTAPAGKEFKAWSVAVGQNPAVEMNPGAEITVTADTVVRAVWITPIPAFGPADFTLPAALTRIEEKAFNGIPASRVDVPGTCVSIGAQAFADCPNLTQIRIPNANCQIGENTFAGCTLVYLYAPAGSPAQTYAEGNDNCVFVEITP